MNMITQPQYITPELLALSVDRNTLKIRQENYIGPDDLHFSIPPHLRGNGDYFHIDELYKGMVCGRVEKPHREDINAIKFRVYDKFLNELNQGINELQLMKSLSGNTSKAKIIELNNAILMREYLNKILSSVDNYDSFMTLIKVVPPLS